MNTAESLCDIETVKQYILNPNDPKYSFVEKNFTLRLNVASNPSTPPETLTKLAEDKNIHVRYTVARNSNTPPETLTKLAEDKKWEDEYIRVDIAHNPSTPPETLAQLAEDENADIRENVASNPNTPPETLTQLAAKNSLWIMWGMAHNPNIPSEIWFQLTKYQLSPNHTLLGHVERDAEEVRQAAHKNPSKHAFLNHRAVQDGICEVGQQMPVEWLEEMYLTKHN